MLNFIYYVKTWFGRFILAGFLILLGGILMNVNVKHSEYIFYLGALILVIQTVILSVFAILNAFRQ